MEKGLREKCEIDLEEKNDPTPAGNELAKLVKLGEEQGLGEKPPRVYMEEEENSQLLFHLYMRDGVQLAWGLGGGQLLQLVLRLGRGQLLQLAQGLGGGQFLQLVWGLGGGQLLQLGCLYGG